MSRCQGSDTSVQGTAGNPGNDVLRVIPVIGWWSEQTATLGVVKPTYGLGLWKNWWAVLVPGENGLLDAMQVDTPNTRPASFKLERK